MTPLRKAFEVYLSEELGVSPQSAATYLRTLHGYWDLPTPVAPATFLAQATGPAGTRSKSYITSLVVACRHLQAFLLDYAPEVAGPSISTPKGVMRRGRAAVPRDALTEAAHRDWLAYVRSVDLPPAVRVVLQLVSFTAMRIAEVCALRIEDIKMVNVGGKMVPVLDFVGKGAKRRQIPLIPDARRLLAHWVESSDIEATSGPLFSSTRGTAITPAVVREAWNGVRAGTPWEAVTPHVLRHTAATAMLRNKVDLVTLQGILGHRSIKTTANYLHVEVGMKLEALEALGVEAEPGPTTPTTRSPS